MIFSFIGKKERKKIKKTKTIANKIIQWNVHALYQSSDADSQAQSTGMYWII